MLSQHLGKGHVMFFFVLFIIVNSVLITAHSVREGIPIEVLKENAVFKKRGKNSIKKKANMEDFIPAAETSAKGTSLTLKFCLDDFRK